MKNNQDRARILRNWSKAIAENSQDIAELMCLESGKPLAESKGEVNYAKSFIDTYAGMGADGMVLPAQSNNHMLLVTKEVRGSSRQIVAELKIQWLLHRHQNRVHDGRVACEIITLNK